MVTALGGQQTARTLHFLLACALVLFLLVHVAAVCQTGFRSRIRAMVTGRGPAMTEEAVSAGLSRRQLIQAGLGALAGGGGVGRRSAAARIAAA